MTMYPLPNPSHPLPHSSPLLPSRSRSHFTSSSSLLLHKPTISHPSYCPHDDYHHAHVSRP